MTISVGCPDCGKLFKVPDALAGKKGRCKSCGGAFQVPATVEPVPEVDPFYDLEAPKPPRAGAPAPEPEEDTEVAPARATKVVKTRRSRSRDSGDGETDPVYRWGFRTIVFAVLGLSMPFFGIQFKGLHLLPPEAQAGILFLALLVGTGLLAGGKPASTFQRVAKYLWLTFMAFVVLAVALVVMGVMSGHLVDEPPPGTVVPAPGVQAPPRAPPARPVASVPGVSGPIQPLPVPPRPTGPRPPGSKPILVGPTLFTITNGRVAHRPGGKKADIDFRIDYQTLGEIPPGTIVYGVAESGRWKTNFRIQQVGTPNGQVVWWSTLNDTERGPFRLFLATIAVGPDGKNRGWIQLSEAIEGLPVLDN